MTFAAFDLAADQVHQPPELLVDPDVLGHQPDPSGLQPRQVEQAFLVGRRAVQTAPPCYKRGRA